MTARAERAVVVYHRLQRELASPRSLPPGEKSWRDADECVSCGAPRPKWERDQRRKVCRNRACRKPWTKIAVVEGVSGPQRPNPPRERDMDLYADLGKILGELDTWEHHALVALSLWPWRGRRIPQVAAALAQRWPERPGGWSRRIVEDLVASAARKVEARLEAAGLLEGE